VCFGFIKLILPNAKENADGMQIANVCLVEVKTKKAWRQRALTGQGAKAEAKDTLRRCLWISHRFFLNLTATL